MLGLGSSLSSTPYTQSLEVSGYSLSLDGVSDYVTFTDQTYNVSGSGSNGSISFWAKRTDNNDEASILGHSGGIATKRLYFDSDGNRLDIESEQNGQTAHAAVTADTNWHHYVVTWAGTSGGSHGNPIMYEDGSALTTTNGNFGVTADKHFVVDIIGSGGGSPGSHTAEFKGLIYQLGIWDVTLDADAVAAIYNSGTPIPLQANSGNYDNSGDLVTLWRFDEGTGTSTTDAIGGLTGTFVGDAAFSSTTP
tara:strand:- start:908 stop:1657 length:750 start_codon:yes stop_codon:yes gene_type:complete